MDEFISHDSHLFKTFFFEIDPCVVGKFKCNYVGELQTIVINLCSLFERI